MADLRFEEWVAEFFSHPVNEKGWWWDFPEDQPSPSPPLSGAVGLDRFRRLCEQADSWSTPYSDAELGQGLWHLFDSLGGTLATPLLDRALDVEQRVRAIAAIEQLYLKLFKPRCRPVFERLATSGSDDALWSLNETCHMVWDINYLYEPWGTQPEAAIDEACLAVLRAILHIPHAACQGSALHGLAHWHERHAARTTEIIDDFLAGNVDLPPDLLSYARKARTGEERYRRSSTGWLWLPKR